MRGAASSGRSSCSTSSSPASRPVLDGDDPVDAAVLEVILAANDSLVAYRRRHRSDVEPDAAFALLVRDGTNPRSVAASIERFGQHADRRRMVRRASRSPRPHGMRWRCLASELVPAVRGADRRRRRQAQRALVRRAGEPDRGGGQVSERGERRYRVVHRTTYRYESPMTDGYTVAHLLPRDTPRQRVAESVVECDARAVGARRARRRVRQPRHAVRHPPPARRARRRSGEHGGRRRSDADRRRRVVERRGCSRRSVAGRRSGRRSARSGRGHASSTQPLRRRAGRHRLRDRSHRAAGSPRPPPTCATGSSTSSRTTRRPPTCRARSPTCWRHGVACARTSPIWRPVVCARSGSPPDTSAATSRPPPPRRP